MRLSALVIVAILLISATLLAQHSSGSGGSSSGGANSGGSYSGSGSSGGFSHSNSASSGSSSSSHASSAGGSQGSGNASSSSARNNSGNTGSTSAKDGGRAGSNLRAHNSGPSSTAKPEKKGFFSFLRRGKQAPAIPAMFNPRVRCKKGQNCAPSCAPGRVWDGFACGVQYQQYWSNNCRALAEELAAQKQQMWGQNDPGQSLRYRMLLDEYQQCMARFGRAPFDSFAFLDIP